MFVGLQRERICGSIISLSVFVRQRRGGQRIGVRVLDADRFGEDKELILLKKRMLAYGINSVVRNHVLLSSVVTCSEITCKNLVKQ